VAPPGARAFLCIEACNWLALDASIVSEKARDWMGDARDGVRGEKGRHGCARPASALPVHLRHLISVIIRSVQSQVPPMADDVLAVARENIDRSYTVIN
jgi:hypothetical protein